MNNDGRSKEGRMRGALIVALALLLGCADDGKNGVQGLVGPQGVRGVVGTTGAPGPTGATGPVGPTGLAGEDGAAGVPGPAGATGPKGSTGSTGPTGPAGAAGAPGGQGVPGPTGATGATGPVGPAITKAALYEVATDASISGGQTGFAIAACADPSDILLSGACDGASEFVRFYRWRAWGFDAPGAASSWQCWAYNSSTGSVAFTAHAYCLAVP